MLKRFLGSVRDAALGREEQRPITLPYAGPDSHALQQLDLFVGSASTKREYGRSKGAERAGVAPLLIFIHGGAWRTGDKSQHYRMARYLARNGVTVALINYRLSTPSGGQVLHPTHAQDAASAVEFLLCQDPSHAREPWRDTFDASKAVLVGHSVGAHMVSAFSLAPDAAVPSNETPVVVAMPRLCDRARQNIKVWIGVSGIYSIVSMLRCYPEYISFVEQAFGSAGNEAKDAQRYHPASLEAWRLANPGTYAPARRNAPSIHLLHSQQDELLAVTQSTEAAEHLARLVEPHGGRVGLHLDSYKGTHDGSLQTEEYFQSLFNILKVEGIL